MLGGVRRISDFRLYKSQTLPSKVVKNIRPPNYQKINAFNMHCNAILKGNKCILKLFFTKSSKKICEKIETPPPRKPAKNFSPPFETCEETATLLRDPPVPQHMFLTAPLYHNLYIKINTVFKFDHCPCIDITNLQVSLKYFISFYLKTSTTRQQVLNK